MDSLSSSIVSLNFIQSISKTKPSSPLQDNTRDEKQEREILRCYTPQQRNTMTLCIIMSFVAHSMASNMLGPTLLHMGYLLDSNIATISLAFAFEWCGYLAGCMVCGILYPRINEEFQFCIANLAMGSLTVICAWMPTAYLFFVAKLVQCLAMGYHDILSHTTMLKLWSGHKLQPIMYQTFLVSHPLGAVLGPLIAAPFLVDLPQSIDVTNSAFVGSNSTSTGFNSLANGSHFVGNETMEMDDFGYTTQASYEEIGRVRYSYAISGGLSVAMAIVYGIVFVSMNVTYTFHRQPLSEDALNAKQGTKASKILLIICVCFISFATAYMVIMSWISPLVVEYLGWDSRHGSFIASSYWLGMVMGRIFGVFILMKIAAVKLLTFHLIATVAAVLFTHLAVLHQENLLWICVPLTGLAVSTTFSSLMLWLSTHVTMSSRVTSSIVSCAAIGFMSAGVVTGYLFQTLSPLWVIYLCFIASVVQIIFFGADFVTIATILGTGILGLPVTLANSGLYPFLVSFILGFFVQGLLIYFTTDILQRAHAVQEQSLKAAPQSSERVPLYDIDAETDLDDLEDEHESNGAVMAGHIIIAKATEVEPPNLHLLGKLFLCRGVSHLFDALIIIQFMAFLTSYALAGPQAYGQVIGVDYFYVIPAFVWVLTVFIVFALSCIQPIVSLLTFVKGSLILATVVATFAVGASVSHDISNDFSYAGAPLLMGTVALGGVMNIMPFLYAKIQPLPRQVGGFRSSVIAGLATCTVINILWCWAVLDIVPQTNSCFKYHVLQNNSMHSAGQSLENPEQKTVCALNLSLATSALNGEISSVPLTKIIKELYPAYSWVAVLVQLFIMISITVSFLTLGAAMHHTLMGCIASLFDKSDKTVYSSRSDSKDTCTSGCCTKQNLLVTAVSLAAFSVIFTVAMLNPKGFVQMLEKVASLFLNLEAGVFMYAMAVRARAAENRSLKIPLPLADWQHNLAFFLPLYFGFAIIYDLFASIYEIVYHDARLPWEHRPPVEGLLLPTNETALSEAATTHAWLEQTVDLLP